MHAPLGAGTATILAFLLREKYPARTVLCYAFSPPGGLLSEAAARESEKFTMSILVGDDVVPRLSLPNIKKLSADIKHSIQTCSLPKYQIFGESLLAVTQTDCRTSLQATAVLAVSVGTTKLLSLLSWTDCTHLKTSPPPPRL